MMSSNRGGSTWTGLILLSAMTLLTQPSQQVLETADEPPSRPPLHRSDLPPPVISNDTDAHVMSPIGLTAHLHCRVHHLADKTVSWVRQSDVNILTAGVFTYTSDRRFQALHSTGSSEWTLKILAPAANDSGVYECQVSTEPKLSRAFSLQVVESKAEIIGGNDLHIRSGSQVNVTCQLSHDTEPIFWFHGQRMIGTESSASGRLRVSRHNSTSRLQILAVTSSDTGNYTCAPLGARAASVYLHVLSEEPPAAMQHNSGPGLWCHVTSGTSFLLTAGLFLLQQ